MGKTVEVDLLKKEIEKALENYSDDISEIVEKTANKIGKEAVDELKKDSPKGYREEYAKGWTLKKDKKGKNVYKIKIHNKTNYQLTHLLEFGHATRNGKRTKAQPHIRPAEEKYSEKFENELEKEIRGLK